MRVRLKGIHRVTMRLADGSTATYCYAWRGGPRLPGQPGAAEFLAAYNAAISAKIAPSTDTLSGVLTSYQSSEDYDRLADRTKRDYRRLIGVIERKFGTLPVAALADKRTRGILLAWRDTLAKSSRRQADYCWAVLARILSWALNRGIVPNNPCERGGLIYRGSRADKIWTAADEQLFLARSPSHLHLPLLLALWTGQRQGDLLRLPWSAYDGAHIRLRQSKTGVRVTIPVSAPLKSALDATPKQSPLVLVNSIGRPWTSDGFRTSWRKACAAAGIVGVTFHDLRGTAVTRLAVAGCTEPEIATLTGHSLKDVRAILDANYLHRDRTLAESAIRKFERAKGKQKDVK
jgi:integrase